MIYSEAHRAVVYTLRDPTLLCQTIPLARRLDAHRVAVPVRQDTMEVCQRLGLRTVSPMVAYDWPGIHKPFAHQRVMADFMAMTPKCFNLSDMGTGKTLACLWAADHLMRARRVHKALIICTLSTMHSAWGDEVFRNFLGRRTAAILHGSVDRRRAELERDVDFYIINHDGLTVRGMLDAIAKRTDIDLVIIDEASAFKHPGTRRYTTLRYAIEKRPRVWVLTGTPAANAPTDAWGISRLIKATGMGFSAFKDRTMERVGNFRWVPRAGSAEVVAQALQPSIRFKREDCIDLPECMTQTREVGLSDTQKLAYEQMKKELAVTVASGARIDAVNEAVLRGKLIQIACGAVYGPDHEVHQLDAKPKLDELAEVIDSVEAKVIIFAPLTSVVRMIYHFLRDKHAVEIISGGVAQGARTKIFRDFQQAVNPRIIVADPRAMAHGLTLTEAATIVWFGPIDSLEVYLQANARINRPGQKRSMLVVHLASTPVEREIYRRLAEKESLQGAVLKLVERK